MEGKDYSPEVLLPLYPIPYRANSCTGPRPMPTV